MSKQFLSAAAWILVLIFSCASWAQLINYSTLQMRNLDEMRTEVRAKLDEARAFVEEDSTEEALTALQEATTLIFSRPNGDNMVGTLFQDVRPRLIDLEAYESSIEKLANQAIAKLKDEKEKPSTRATQLVLLENLLSEFKPEIKRNEKIKAIVIKIRDAQLVVPKAANNDFRLKGLTPRRSPSDIAKDLIGK